MKTLPLRELLRHPSTVRKLTAAGQSVQITDRGEPLWVVAPAKAVADDEERKRMIDEELKKMLAEPEWPVSASKLILDSRVL